MHENHRCEHEGCNKTEPENTIIACHLIDYGDYKVEPKDIYLYYCSEHATEEGFCWCCGEFWAGCEEFDFQPSHLCPNCKDDLDSELADDYDSECDFGEV